MKKEIFKRAFEDTVPVMAGYLVLGTGFGMILKAKGMGIIVSLLMSVFIYAGSMQYAAVTLLTGGASYLTVALTTLMVNCRHLFYGVSMVEKYKNTGLAKPYLMFALTDETYSLAVSVTDIENPKDRKNYYVLISVLDQLYWVAGSVAGSLLGTAVKINTQGIDFALTALFVTIFVEQWKLNKNHLSAILGLALTALCLVIFGSEYFLIASMISVVAVLLIIRGKEEPKYG